MIEHKVFDILSVIVDTHRTRSAAAGCRSIVPALRIFFNNVSILPHFEHFIILGLKELSVNKILFNVVYSQNNMLFTAKFVIFVLCDIPRLGSCTR